LCLRRQRALGNDLESQASLPLGIPLSPFLCHASGFSTFHEERRICLAECLVFFFQRVLTGSPRCTKTRQANTSESVACVAHALRATFVLRTSGVYASICPIGSGVSANSRVRSSGKSSTGTPSPTRRENSRPTDSLNDSARSSVLPRDSPSQRLVVLARSSETRQSDRGVLQMCSRHSPASGTAARVLLHVLTGDRRAKASSMVAISLMPPQPTIQT